MHIVTNLSETWAYFIRYTVRLHNDGTYHIVTKNK